MKCPYPDCTGQVTPGEQFCGECGRSLTWENGQPLTVLASSGGAPKESGPTGPMPILPPPPPITPPPAYGSAGEPPTYTPLNTYTPTPSPSTPPDYSTSPETAAYTPPPATPPNYGSSSETVAFTPQPAPPPGYTPPAAGSPPGYTPSAAPPPGYTPPAAGSPPSYTPPPGYAPPTAAMPPAAAPAAKSGPNPLVLILVGGGVGIVLLCMACFGLPFVLALLAPASTPTPVPPTRVVRLPTSTSRPIALATATTKKPPTVAVPPTAEALATETPLLLSDTPVVPEGTEGPDPNATATAVASDFDIDFTDYQNSAGADVIVGIVHNKGTDRLENVEVTAELLDGSGAVVGTGSDILLPLAIMEGNQTLPFQVTIEEGNDVAERIHVKVHADVYDATGFHLFDAATGLTVEGATLADGILGPTLSGQVKNGGAKPATLVHVVAVGYDDAGEIVDTGTGYVTSDIAAGESGQFELYFLRPDAKITKYDVAVIGQESP